MVLVGTSLFDYLFIPQLLLTSPCTRCWIQGLERTNKDFFLKGAHKLERETYIAITLVPVQFSSVQSQLCPTLCDPMNRSTPGLPVHHQLPEFTQTNAHQVSDAIQPSHPLLSLCPPALSPSQHQGLFQWVNSSHEVAKVLEFQLQHQSFQWTPRADLL